MEFSLPEILSFGLSTIFLQKKHKKVADLSMKKFFFEGYSSSKTHMPKIYHVFLFSKL
jgi:hypothetical protein